MPNNHISHKRNGHYQQAKKEGYRARSAYKLLEIQKRYNIFKRARIVAEFNDKQKYSALNDIGIFSAKSASLIRYTLNLNNEHPL